MDEVLEASRPLPPLWMRKGFVLKAVGIVDEVLEESRSLPPLWLRKMKLEVELTASFASQKVGEKESNSSL